MLTSRVLSPTDDHGFGQQAVTHVAFVATVNQAAFENVYATCYTTLTYVLVLDCVRCWCRQYMDNGMRIDSKDMSKLVSETWRTLTSKERSPYEKRARSETLQYEEERRVFEKKHKIWADLQHKAKASG